MSALRRPTVEQFRTFVAVAESAGFAGAAQRLGRTQSALTHQIQSLEEILGTRLVLRSRGHFGGLTHAGATLLPRARGVLGAVDTACRSVGGDGLAGRVRIGVVDDFDFTRIIGLIAAVQAHHPGVEVTVVADLTARLEDRLAAGEIDLAIARRLDREEDGPAAGEVPLGLEPLGWAAAPGWLPPASVPIPLVVFHEGCVYRRRLLARLDRAGVPWRIAFAGASYAGVRAATAAGLGVTVLPEAQILPAYGIVPAAEVGLDLPDPGTATLVVLSGAARPDPGLVAVRREITRRIGAPPS